MKTIYFLIIMNFALLVVFQNSIAFAQSYQLENTTVAISGNDTSFSLSGFASKFVSYFEPNGAGWNFLFFVFGLALYSIFVYYSYLYVSKRELIPKFHLKFGKSEALSKKLKIVYVASHVFYYPFIIFVFFIIFAYLIFLTSQEILPMKITIYVSMALIGVVRLLAYFKEDLAQQVASNIPFCLMAVFLTSTVVADPNFLTTEKMSTAFLDIEKYLPGIISAVIVLSILEGICRLAFTIKRKILPVKDRDSSKGEM